MKNFISIFLMCAVGIFFFLLFGFGLFNNLWGIIAISAFLMAAVITAFMELWRKTEELEGRIRALEKADDGQKRLGRRFPRRSANARQSMNSKRFVNRSARNSGVNRGTRMDRRS